MQFQVHVSRLKAERDWHQFHQPKDLLLGIVEEVGEFRNLVKWEQDPARIEQILVLDCPPERQKEILDFFGDMLWYTASLADYCKVDLSEAMQHIVEKMPVRFPAERVKGTTANHRTGGYDGQYSPETAATA